MAKLKFIQEEQKEEIDYNNLFYVYDTEAKKNVTIKCEDYPELKKEISCLKDMCSGIQFLKQNDDVKLIVEYKDLSLPNDKLKDYWYDFTFPFKRENGEVVNVLSVNDIIKYSQNVTFYTTTGKKIYSLTRGEIWRYRCRDFDVKFNADNFVIAVSDTLYNAIEIEKMAYSYSGKLLSKASKKLAVKDLMKDEINNDDSQMSK